MSSSSSSFRSVNASTPKRDGPVIWALNGSRLSNNVGTAIALQEREGTIFVCVRKSEATSWVPFHRVMSQAQLQVWLKDGGFPRASDKPKQY